MSLEFLITSFIIVASPGTGALYTLAAGLSRGSRASVVAAFGCTLGCVPHLAAAILGLAALLHASAVAFETVKYLGVAYLLYMAWNTLRERGALSVSRQSDARSFVQVTIEAILINLLNPKLSIFFLAFLPQFLSTDEAQPLPHMLMLSAVFMLMTFVVFAAYGLFAAAMRDHVISRPSVMVWMPHLRRRLRSAGRPARPHRTLMERMSAIVLAPTSTQAETDRIRPEVSGGEKQEYSPST